MKWPDERRDEECYPGRYRRAAHDFVASYLEEPWRKKAVALVRKAVEQCIAAGRRTRESLRPPSREQLSQLAEAAGLFQVAAQLSKDDGSNGVSLEGALLAEAAGSVFCSRPSIPRWKIVGQIIGDDPVARMVLIWLVTERMAKRPELRDDIRAVARKLVHQSADETQSLYQQDIAVVKEMHRRWTTRPDLHEVWFGLQGNQDVMPIRRDDYIFDLLFEVDTAFAAELIEEYKSPYQPAIILEFGACVPRRMFGDWERLMQHAQPAFEEDGTWNNRILLPLLLYFAQDATRSNPVHQDETEDGEDIYTAEIKALAECVSMTLWKRPDGCAAALRWSAWLFRSIMSSLDSEGATYPRDIHSRAFPEWRIVQAAVEPQRAANWLEHTHQDVEIEDELCVVAVKILAAHKHKLPAPGRKLLFEMLPDEPEEFLEGTNGKRLQRLPSLFTIWGKRADAFGTRILAAALFDGRVAENFGKLWNRTLVLREIVEHSLVFREDTEGHDDSQSRASETIAFVVSLGINLIDYIQDKHDDFEIEDRHRETLSLLSIMHDATREMIAIDPIGRGRMQHIHDHLCVRRLLYEAPQVGESIGAAPLYETDCPTAGDLLFERSEISRSFFNCLQMLLANGVTRERIKQALSEVGLRLGKLVEQAQTLNVIEHNRKLNLEGL